MYGGGTFVTQNKILPGAYINVVSAARATATLGKRGIAAIALPLTPYRIGEVIHITSMEFIQTPDDILGEGVPESSMRVLRELFQHATEAYIYNSYNGVVPATHAVITISLNGVTPTTGVAITGGTTTITQLGALQVNSTAINTLFSVAINGEAKDWTDNGSEVVPAWATITLTAIATGKLTPAVLTAFNQMGGTYSYSAVDGAEQSSAEAPEIGEICLGLEPYEFNALACYTGESDEIQTYISQIEAWRDQYGKKCIGVVYNTEADHEGIVNVTSTVSDSGIEPYALVAWVTGAQAGCEVNQSCTNMIYDGEYTVRTNLSQSGLEQAILNGHFVFHLAYGDVRVLDDINSLVTTTMDKGEDFKSNQTMRVVDQIANDIAKLFNTKYLGIIPNDQAGRTSLWADIVKHHQELQSIRAIQNFDSSLLTVEQGDTKKSVVVNDVVNPVNAMAQLYMTVVVQ